MQALARTLKSVFGLQFTTGGYWPAGGDSRHDDVALPPLAMKEGDVHRDAAGHLHDSPERPTERIWQVKPGQPGRQAAVRQRSVLRTIVATVTYRPFWRATASRRIVAKRGSARRDDGGVVFPVLTLRPLGLARFRRLQGKTQFAFGGGRLLSLWDDAGRALQSSAAARGLPVGLMLLARNCHDRRLFRIAAAVEQLLTA
jgi:hypothetical protein